jgi:hypothetical protein
LSCTKHNEIAPTSIFIDSTRIKGKVVNANLDNINQPVRAIMIDSLLILKDLKATEYNFHIINVHEEKLIKSFAKAGRGPKEIEIPLGFNIKPGKGRDINTYARTKKKLFCFNIDSVLHNDQYDPQLVKRFTEDYLTPVLLQNNRFISTGPFEKGRYRISDSSLKTHSFKYDYPNDPDKSNVSRPTKSMVYQGNYALQPHGKYFAFAAGSCGVIEIFQSKSKTVKKIKNHHFYNPEYQVESDTEMRAPINATKNRNGFADLCATQKYLYALFSGRTFWEYRNKFAYGKDVLVFDWKGNPIMHYKLDRAVRCIGVNKTNSLLYAYAALPEPAILKYSLVH